MSYSRDIVCLANSKKMTGRCIGGRDIHTGEWIRPVSARATHEIQFTESACQNGAQPELLDIVRIQFTRAVPQGHQRENHEIDARYSWQKVGRYNFAQASSLIEKPATLWMPSDRSFHGLHDRVEAADAARMTSSLVLLQPTPMKLVVRDESRFQALGFDRKVRLEFDWAGALHCIAVTDPTYEYLRQMGLAEYDVSGWLVCISLSEPFSTQHHRSFKLAAGLLRSPIVPHNSQRHALPPPPPPPSQT